MHAVPGSVVPLYHQIYLVLRDRCVADCDATLPLPGELDLARQYKVSRITMRKALDQLVQEGLVTRRRGAGTFVNPAVARQAQEQRRSAGLLENIISSALDTTVRVICLERAVPPPEVAAELGLATGEAAVRTVRVRSIDKGPVSHITTYVPAAIGGRLHAESLSARPMLTLLEEQGVKVGHARQTITARLADTDVAALLDVPVGAPLLAVRRLVLDVEGRPVQWLRGLYRPDRYEYRMDLWRGGDEEARVWYQRDQAGRP
jgi:GntR family transcriptional regulator